MTPIEIIEGRYGYKILTGTAETDLSSLNIVAITIRSAGAKLAKLEVNDSDIRTARGLAGEDLDSLDSPILAGYNDGTKTTLKFNLIQLTNASDSVAMYFGKAQ